MTSDTSIQPYSYYDLVMGLIPTAFLLAVLLIQILGIPTLLAVAGASLVGGVVIGHAVFVRPPAPVASDGSVTGPDTPAH